MFEIDKDTGDFKNGTVGFFVIFLGVLLVGLTLGSCFNYVDSASYPPNEEYLVREFGLENELVALKAINYVYVESDWNAFGFFAFGFGGGGGGGRSTVMEKYLLRFAVDLDSKGIVILTVPIDRVDFVDSDRMIVGFTPKEDRYRVKRQTTTDDAIQYAVFSYTLNLPIQKVKEFVDVVPVVVP